MVRVSFLSIRKKDSPRFYGLVLCACVLLDYSQLQADSPFFKRRAEGWHWYENFSKEQEPIRKREEKKGYVEKSSPSPQTPTKIIEEQKKALEQKLHAAIIEPSRENITSYLIAQRALMDQSQRFAESWKEVVMKTPSLDETLAHPVDQNARHVYYQERQKTLTHRIKALATEYGLFFFFPFGFKLTFFCFQF